MSENVLLGPEAPIGRSPAYLTPHQFVILWQTQREEALCH